MRVEPSRDPEGHWAYWRLPAGLHPTDAERHFLAHVKPRIYTYETFRYDPKTGVLRTC